MCFKVHNWNEIKSFTVKFTTDPLTGLTMTRAQFHISRKLSEESKPGQHQTSLQLAKL